MEPGAFVLTLLEDLSGVVRYTLAVDSLKQQMVDEVFSIRKQMQDGENANGEYVRGVHDAYVSLVQALDAIKAPQLSAPPEQSPSPQGDPWDEQQDSTAPATQEA